MPTLNLPPPDDMPELNHVDDNGRIKQSPPLIHPDAEPPPTDNLKEVAERIPDRQRQRMALRNIYKSMSSANSEEELSQLEELTKHIPFHERERFVKQIDSKREGIKNRQKMKHLVQVRNLNKMARR